MPTTSAAPTSFLSRLKTLCLYSTSLFLSRMIECLSVDLKCFRLNTKTQRGVHIIHTQNCMMQLPQIYYTPHTILSAAINLILTAFGGICVRACTRIVSLCWYGSCCISNVESCELWKVNTANAKIVIFRAHFLEAKTQNISNTSINILYLTYITSICNIKKRFHTLNFWNTSFFFISFHIQNYFNKYKFLPLCAPFTKW